MKKFLKQISYFLILAIISLNLIEYLLPYYYGNNTFASKLSYLENNESKFNTLFLGSSRTDHSISPQIIDSVLTEENIKSFNFGVGGTSNPESYYLTENIIKKIDSTKIKVIVLEVSPLRDMSLKNIKTTRNTYYHSTKQSIFSLRVLKEESYPFKYKTKLVFKYLLHYLKNKINFSKLIYLRDSSINIDKIDKTNYNGFKTTVIHGNSIFPAKRNDLQKSLSYELDSLQKTSISFSTHAKRLNKIYLQSKEKGIKLFFLVQPKDFDYTFLNNLTGKLPKGSLINIASASKHPEFYEEYYSLDPGHLNSRGAIIFSKTLAKEIKLRLNQNK